MVHLSQLHGLGRNDEAQFFGLDGIDEAGAYLAHPLLGPRLLACTAAIAAHAEVGPVFVFGEVEALKLRCGAPAVFAETLARLAAPNSGDD